MTESPKLFNLIIRYHRNTLSLPGISGLNLMRELLGIYFSEYLTTWGTITIMQKDSGIELLLDL